MAYRADSTSTRAPAEAVFWKLLDTYAAFSRKDTFETDHQDARKAWKTLTRCNLDEEETATLLNATWRYTFARRLRTAQKKTRRGDMDKAAKLTAADLATQCLKLEKSLRGALRDPASRHLLTAFCVDDQIPPLIAQLRQAGSALGKITMERSQAHVVTKMRHAALVEMVGSVAPSDKNVPWTALAKLVNLIAQGDPYGSSVSIAGVDLEREYRRLTPRH